MSKGNGILVPVIPRFALQLVTRIVEAGARPGENNVIVTINRILPHLENADKWEVYRAVMAMFGDTPDQLLPLKG